MGEGHWCVIRQLVYANSSSFNVTPATTREKDRDENTNIYQRGNQHQSITMSSLVKLHLQML